MSTNDPNKTNAASNFQFRTPAGIQDFPDDAGKQNALDQLWNANLNGFTEQGLRGNPWNATNAPVPTNYYNPEVNNPTAGYQAIPWSAFPGRLAYNYPSTSQDQLNEWADNGLMTPNINNSPCDTSSGSSVPYFPYGPRGWQDEYCEWAVTRDTNGNIIRIDFTCENPEYWNSLWLIDPNQVLALYQSILDKPQITLEDLSLPGVTNPITGGPIYNPLNKWNTGTSSTPTSGGAVHLTSTPNTLQTEIGLATAASVQRINSDGTIQWSTNQFNALLCDAQFGQKFRNSDPNIGGNVNSLVNSGQQPGGQGLMVTLANPPGLYIQTPDFTTYANPKDPSTPASSFWTIKRGTARLYDEYDNLMPGDFILHAVFEVPASYGYTVSDLTIGGVNIGYGSQVAKTFMMHIIAMGYSGTVPQGYQPVGSPSPANTFAQPLQLFYEDYFTAMFNTSVPNPMNNPISLLSNSTFIPPTVFQGASAISMVLTCSTCTAVPNQPSTFPKVTFDDPNITAVVTKVNNSIYYAVPGNSLPSTQSALYIIVTVGNNAAIGRRAIYITNQGQAQSISMPALLEIAPVTVQANIAWQSTGIMVIPEVRYNIAYKSGLWTANPEDNNGQLYNAAGNPSFIPAKQGYTMPGQNEGAMIGRIGNNAPFLIGMGATVPSNQSGELQLCINDDLTGIYGAGLTDNIGSIQLTVTF